MTLTIGVSQLTFEDQAIAEEAFEALRRPGNCDVLPMRASLEFPKVLDASQVGHLARYRGGAPALAVVNTQTRNPFLRFRLGRLELQIYDQLALRPAVALFRTAAERAAEVFLPPVRLPAPRISRPEAIFADEPPDILLKPVTPVSACPPRPAGSVISHERQHLMRPLESSL